MDKYSNVFYNDIISILSAWLRYQREIEGGGVEEEERQAVLCFNG